MSSAFKVKKRGELAENMTTTADVCREAKKHGKVRNSPLLLGYACDIVRTITTLGGGMEKPVSAADANRKFSKLLRAVREGDSYVVTSHGRAVARIVPAEKDSGVTRGAKVALLKRLRSEPAIKIGRWNRDELYEDKK